KGPGTPIGVYIIKSSAWAPRLNNSSVRKPKKRRIIFILNILKSGGQAGGEVTGGYITTAFRLQPSIKIEVIRADTEIERRASCVIKRHPSSVRLFHANPYPLRVRCWVRRQKSWLFAVFRPGQGDFDLVIRRTFAVFQLKDYRH